MLSQPTDCCRSPESKSVVRAHPPVRPDNARSLSQFMVCVEMGPTPGRAKIAPDRFIRFLPPVPYKNLSIVGARRENVRRPVMDFLAAPATPVPTGVKPPYPEFNTNHTKNGWGGSPASPARYFFNPPIVAGVLNPSPLSEHPLPPPQRKRHRWRRKRRFLPLHMAK